MNKNNRSNSSARKDFEEMFSNPNHPKYVGDEYELLSEYKNNTTKVKILHKCCGKIFETKPLYFKHQGTRCPHHKNNNLKSKQKFEKLIESEPDYELLSEYFNSYTKVKIKHLKCGTIYEVEPRSFKENHRCPNCFGYKIKKNLAKKDFEEMFSNPNHLKYVGDEYELLSEYKNNTTKVKIKHSCDNVYEVIPQNFKMGNRCPKCSSNGTSKEEKILQEWIKQYINIETNKRFYDDGKYIYELDIYIPSKNIGIEFDGIYWHSELNGKDKNYHLNKTEFFEKKGIQLIHIFENEWEKNKKEIVKSIIKSKIGLCERIYARKCNIKEVDSKTSFEFLENNHIQGGIHSSIRLGLYYQNELVALMTFGKPRYSKKYDWELHRYVSKLNTTIVGGFSKLLSHFRKNHKGSIVSYADRRYSVGNVYEKNGFELSHISKPDYFYFKFDYNNVYHRSSFQKHKLEKKLDIFDSKLTEWENMQLNGYDRIWDCGNLVFLTK